MVDLATGLTARYVNRVGEALRGNKRFDGLWRSVVRPTWPGRGVRVRDPVCVRSPHE